MLVAIFCAEVFPDRSASQGTLSTLCCFTYVFACTDKIPEFGCWPLSSVIFIYINIYIYIFTLFCCRSTSLPLLEIFNSLWHVHLYIHKYYMKVVYIIKIGEELCARYKCNANPLYLTSKLFRMCAIY